MVRRVTAGAVHLFFEGITDETSRPRWQTLNSYVCLGNTTVTPKPPSGRRSIWLNWRHALGRFQGLMREQGEVSVLLRLPS